MKKILILIAVVLSFAIIVPSVHADNQMLLGGQTFAFGVNVVKCSFTEFKDGKETKSDRQMIITGEFMGNPTGYLVTPNENEKDYLYFVNLTDLNILHYG